MKLRSLLIAIAFVSTACGTDTGNPGAREFWNGGQGKGEYFANFIVNVTCQKLTDCFPQLRVGDCFAGIDAQENLDEEFGVPAGKYENFGKVYLAEANRELYVDKKSANSCLSAVLDLTCDDQRVIQAYQPNLANPFVGVENIFTPVCRKVYTVK